MMQIQRDEHGPKGAFYIDEDGEWIAELTYVKNKGQMVIDHTEVDEKLRGEGVREVLLEPGPPGLQHRGGAEPADPAVAARRPSLTAAPAEVARIVEPPVSRFLPDAPVEIVERTIRDWPLRYGAYDLDGLSVWGATARILSQLGAILAR